MDKRDANARLLRGITVGGGESEISCLIGPQADGFPDRALDLLKRKWLRELAARVFAGCVGKVDDAGDPNHGWYLRQRPRRLYSR